MDKSVAAIQLQIRRITRTVLSSNTQQRALRNRVQEINISIDSLKRKVIVQNRRPTASTEKKSSHFFLRKGKLPWPLERGIVVKRHNVTAGAVPQLLSYGIEISTEKNSTARAVANGKVVTVSNTHDLHGVIIIQHDNFYTLYSNLERLDVQSGQPVISGEPIGVVKTGKLGYTILHFEVWEETTLDGEAKLIKLNPEHWLRAGF
jgi:murein DD-endopeptidase MepM/ murein hydrolase activator NlpD